MDPTDRQFFANAVRAPGAVGTPGNEVTAWPDAWNRGRNPHDFNRE